MADAITRTETPAVAVVGVAATKVPLTRRTQFTIVLPMIVAIAVLLIGQIAIVYQATECEGDPTPQNVLVLFALVDTVEMLFVPVFLARALTTTTWTQQQLNIRFGLLGLAHVMLVIMAVGVFVSMQTECPQANIDKMFLAEIPLRLFELLAIPIIWYQCDDSDSTTSTTNLFADLFGKKRARAYDVLAGAEEEHEIVFSHKLDTDSEAHLL